ncbi:hypothetical protein [Nonomuraea sp. NPDC003804]
MPARSGMPWDVRERLPAAELHELPPAAAHPEGRRDDAAAGAA